MISTDGNLYMWGESALIHFGALTYVLDSTVPVRTLDNVVFTAYDPFGMFMAITEDGGLYTWGWNMSGSLGNGQREGFETRPVRILENAVYGGFGGENFAITADGGLYTWGQNEYGQLGNGRTARDMWTDVVTRPVRVFDNVVSAASANASMVAATRDGNLYAWGNREIRHSIDRQQAVIDNRPTRVWNMRNIVSVHGGTSSFMALESSGALWAWGWNNYGLIGNGQAGFLEDLPHDSLGLFVDAPFRVLEDVVSIFPAFAHGRAAALKSDGSLWAWGANRPHASLARLHEFDIRPTPERILDDVVTFSIGDRGSVALRSDGSLVQITSSGDRHTHRIVAQGVKLPSGIAPPREATAPNLDTASDWAYDGINRAFALGLIPQHLQNNYAQPITRAEFCALAVTLYESVMGEITGRAALTDTNDLNVQKMAHLGIVTGDGSGRFDPNGTFNRESAAVMCTRLSDAIGWPFPTGAPTFADNSAASPWALGYIGRVQAAGLMGGTGDNNFSPQERYTREQSIITILRMFGTTQG